MGEPSDAGLHTPPERDEQPTGPAGRRPHDEMRRAYRDVEEGQVDTDRRSDAAEVFDRANSQAPDRPSTRRPR